jgi:hypothetical protein
VTQVMMTICRFSRQQIDLENDSQLSYSPGLIRKFSLITW